MKAGGHEWYKLKPFKPTTTINEFGEESLSYTEMPEIHAQRNNIRGTYRNEADEMFSDYTVEWYVRTGASDVCEGWRVQQLGGYLYLVTNVIPNLKRGYKVLVCDRVNE